MTDPGQNFRLVIVEDVPLYREYLVRFCEQEIGCKVVGACSGATEACELIGLYRPDFALLDVCLNQGSGFDVVDWGQKNCAWIRCALMSAYCTDVVAMRAMKSPICGFIDKNLAGMEEFALAIKELARGGVYFSTSYLKAVRLLRDNQGGFEKILTDRELLILGLIGHALTDDEIAEHLSIALGTAQAHRRNILGKLGLCSTPKLIRFAIDHGLTQFVQRPVPRIFVSV